MECLCNSFSMKGSMKNCVRYGNGHINDTFLVLTSQHHEYILQKINTKVFGDVPALMKNIINVTDHLKKKENNPRFVLTLVPTNEGDKYLKTSNGEYWRMYEYVTDSICLDKPGCTNDLRQSGVAFGRFSNQLLDFSLVELTDTIHRFHDTPYRYSTFLQSIENDIANRKKHVQKEIDFFLEYEKESATLLNMHNTGDLPQRVTHNDTKLNNVMLDRITHKPLCVIDLDTVMPGLIAYDFGDSIRFGSSSASEDERELNNVTLLVELFEAYTRGFLGECGKNLTKNEIETLPIGAKLMTLECGVRFITDYLNGDTYFHVSRFNQNLDRARTQIKLIQDMEGKWLLLNKIVHKVAKMM